MSEIRPATRADLSAVATLVARLQADPAHHIGFHGVTVEEILDELGGFEPDWHSGAVLAVDATGGLRGVLSVDVNPEVGRAWLHGPFVDVPSGHPAAPQVWKTTADALYQAVRELPRLAGINDFDLYGHTAHRQLAEFAARHGFSGGHPSRILLLTGPRLRELIARGADHVEPLPADGSLDEQVAVLFDRCFPNSTSSAEQLLRGARGHTVVVLRHGGGQLAGFAAGYVQQEEYLVDYVAVEPDMRCVGVGSQVVRGLLRDLDARHGARPRAAAVVATDNAASAGMFARLGFEVDLELVSYRRQA